MKIWNIGYTKWSNYESWIKAFGDFEQGQSSAEEVLKLVSSQFIERWKVQHELGLDSIAINDVGLWDRLQEIAWTFGLVPQKAFEIETWVDAFKSLNRGDARKTISKPVTPSWFSSGYRYFQPSWNGKEVSKIHTDRTDWEFNLARKCPYPFHFSVIGPWTLSQITHCVRGNKTELLEMLIPLYKELFLRAKKQGIKWIQVEEPAFCKDLDKKEIRQIMDSYSLLANKELNTVLSTYYGSFDPWLSELCNLPVQAFHFDCVSGPAVLSWLKTRAFPKEKILVLGLIDSRNIWASPLASIHKQVEILKGFHPAENIWLAPSAPLWHLPQTKTIEEELKQKPDLFSAISFARERLIELSSLKKLQLGTLKLQEVESEEKQMRSSLSKLNKRNESLHRQLSQIDLSFRKRSSSLTKRSKIQKKKLALPPLPLIGSGQVEFLDDVTQKELGINFWSQETMNLDLLLSQVVSKNEGIIQLRHGWVPVNENQSFRPSIVFSDLVWRKSGNAPEGQQKSCVLGPASLLACSFVRTDISWEQLALQAGFSVRQEVQFQEKSGADAIEVWEGALEVGSPLKKTKYAGFQKQLLDTFKLASTGIKDETLLILNLGSSEVSGWDDFLDKSDSDVILSSLSPEHKQELEMFKRVRFEVGSGINLMSWLDINQSTEQEIEMAIRTISHSIPPHKLWIFVEKSMFQHDTRDISLDEIRKVSRVTKRLRDLLQKA